MSRTPDERYPSARALADDIEHWLADEPVSAWKEPWSVRARRLVTRHRTWVAAAAAALAVAAVAAGHLLHDYHVRIAERRAQADGLLVALQAAEVGEVKGIVDQLSPLRSLVIDRLRSLARGGPTETASSRRNAALALVASDPSQAEYLVERILREDVSPREITVVRQALLDHGRAVILEPRLWRLLEEGCRHGTPNLGAAGALPFSPARRALGEFSSPIASALVLKGPISIGDWREVFQPIARALTGPLRTIFGDSGRPRESARWPSPCCATSQRNRAIPTVIATSPN